MPSPKDAISAGQVLKDREEKNHPEGTKVNSSTSVVGGNCADTVGLDCGRAAVPTCPLSICPWNWALAAVRDLVRVGQPYMDETYIVF